MTDHPSKRVGATDGNGCQTVYRHSLLIRITHWMNAFSFMILIPSGAMILWLHPEFYWGETGYFGDPAWLKLPISPNFDASPYFGRNAHFFAAWILILNGSVYLISGFITRHFKFKMLPSHEELAPAHIWRDIVEHAQLHTAKGQASLHYNVLQKLAYLLVIFVLAPLMVLSGLTMSPGFTAAVPEMFWLWGRQSARSIHFICACSLSLFLLIHIFQVFVAGFVNEITSMFTGRFRIPMEKHSK